MSSYTFCLALLTLLLAMASPAGAQIFEFGKEPTSPLPVHALADEIALLDKRIADLEKRIAGESEPYLLLSLRASLRVRQLAKTMLQGVDEKPSSSRMAMYGFTLSHGAEDLDKLFAEAPAQAAALLKNPDASVEELARLDQTAQALQRFIISKPPASVNTEGMPVHDFLYYNLSPLLRAVEAQQTGSVRSTWLPPRGAGEAAADGGAAGELTAGVTAAQLDALARRAQSTRASPPLVQRMSEVIGVLKVAAPYSDLKPRVSDTFALLGRLLDLVDALDNSAWLPTELRTVIELALGRNLEAYQKPAQRNEARKSLDAALALGPIMTNISSLRSAAVNVSALEQTFAMAVNRTQVQAEATQANEVLDWLRSVSDLLVARRAAAEPDLAVELKSTYMQVMSAFDEAQAQALEFAGKLVTSPQAIDEPKAAGLVQLLESTLRSCEHVVKMPERIQRAEPLQPRPPDGIRLRLMKTMRLLAVDTKRDEALAELDAYASQLRRIENLPGERRLRAWVDAGEEFVEVLGVSAAQLVKALDRQKVQWALIWAGDKDAADGERLVRAIEQLTPLSTGLIELSKLEDAPALINRWAGWQLERRTGEEVIKDLQRRVQAAVNLIRSGRMVELQGELDRIATSMPHGALAGLAVYEFGERLATLPTGAAGVLSQLVYEPSRGAFLGDREHELALLSRCAAEAGHRALRDDDMAMKAVIDHGQWALQVIESSLRREAAH